MTQEAPALGIGTPKEKVGAFSLAKIEANELNPFFVVCKLLSENGFPIALNVAKTEKGEVREGLVTASVSTPEDRQAVLELMKDPRLHTVYIAVSGAGQLRLEECGWDRPIGRGVGGNFWHCNPIPLKRVM